MVGDGANWNGFAAEGIHCIDTTGNVSSVAFKIKVFLLRSKVSISDLLLRLWGGGGFNDTIAFRLFELKFLVAALWYAVFQNGWKATALAPKTTRQVIITLFCRAKRKSCVSSWSQSFWRFRRRGTHEGVRHTWQMKWVRSKVCFCFHSKSLVRPNYLYSYTSVLI